MPKRKASTERPESASKDVCIIHDSNAKRTGFVRFSKLLNPKERFDSICEIRDKRQSQPLGSSQRRDVICGQIPQQFADNHGYHRECYQRFTSNLDRLKLREVTDATGACQSTRQSRRSSAEQVIFEQNCIFCKSFERKKVRSGGAWSTEGLSYFSHGGGGTILALAEERGDEELAIRIRGYDLFASEARYHKHCRMKYCDPSTWRSINEDAKQEVREREKTHELCFSKVCEVIDRRIIIGQEIMQMTDLRDIYIEHLSKTLFENQNYRTETLKKRLEKHKVYSEKLSIVSLDRQGGRLQSALVFSNDLDLATAVRNSYCLHRSISTEIDDVALLLRQVIRDAFSKAGDMPWPPTAGYLETMDSPVPENLQKFLRLVICGNRSLASSEKTERLVSSLGQDLCRAATKGEWKLPKHILVCMTLRHLFRSAQLSTLMNRLGHAESYSFSLELETALATALEEASSDLTPNIVRNPSGPSIFHSDFDNFDQYVDNLTGSGSVHTAHGIMLQNVQRDEVVTKPLIPSVPKTGRRSLVTIEPEDLPPCYLNQRTSPKMIIKHLCAPGSEGTLAKSGQINITWCIVRMLSSLGGQCVPGWGGFISETGVGPTNLTTIDYYPVINHPITDNSTVQECLRMSKQCSNEVGQRYAITTFDLGVCMKAYPILWRSPDTYKDHIVMIGSFHTVCAYLKMVGKKMDGSGFSDVLLQAGLMSSGSLQGVITGKNYSRAMNCHKSFAEGLERMLLRKFEALKGGLLEQKLPEESMSKVTSLLAHRNKEDFLEVLDDGPFQEYMADYVEFRLQVRNGTLGKTGAFWLSYVDHIWLVLSLLMSVKTNDFFLYGACLSKMADLFHSFDGQNYARYLTFFSVFLANIEETHPGATELLKLGAISVARSYIPGNQCPVDKTIEETFMKHAKSHAGAGGIGAGVSGLLGNYEAYRRWAKTAQERSRYLEVMLQMVNMGGESSRDSRHRDTWPSQIQKSEKATGKIIDAVESFLNPFDIESEGLVSLLSGAPVPPDVSKDIETAEERGTQAKEAFITERLEKNEDFFAPLTKQRLKTFADIGKKAIVKTSNNKTLEYKQQGNVAFKLLVKSQNHKLDLQELLRYPLMPVPSAIGTPDGHLLKTDKSKAFHRLVKDMDDADVPPDKDTMNVEDGNAVFHSIKEIPKTFKQICNNILATSTSGKSSVIFSTDSYMPDSVKSLERSTRGSGEKRLIQGENTRRPENWKEFLSNDDNKTQLIELLLRVWCAEENLAKIETKKIILVCKGKAYELMSDDGKVTPTEITSLDSTQEETDSRVILYASYAQEEGYKYVRIRSPDTDIFFILLYYAPNLNVILLFDTGTGNRRRLINVTDLSKEFTPTYCAALLGLHAYSRCDTTSAFKGIGKVKPLRLLQKKPKYQEVFSGLGESWEVTDDLFLALEEFTCIMYSAKTKTKEVNRLRYQMLELKCGGQSLDSKKNVDLSSLPPPKVCLSEHIRRVNYQVAIWKRAHCPKPDVPHPAADHGWIMHDGKLVPCWFKGTALPTSMADILETMDEMADDDSSDEDYESDGDDANETDYSNSDSD